MLGMASGGTWNVVFTPMWLYMHAQHSAYRCLRIGLGLTIFGKYHLLVDNEFNYWRRLTKIEVFGISFVSK